MNKLLLLLLGSTVGLGLVSLHLVNLLHEERDASKGLQARIEALQGAASRPLPPAPPPAPLISTYPAMTPPPSPSPAAAQSGLARALVTAAREMPPPQSATQEDRERLIREQIERQRALLQNPEYREALKAQHKMMLTRTYPGLDRELGLDAEQYDQLLSLLADQQLRQMEIEPAAHSGSGGDLQEFRRKLQQQQQTHETELAALLGTEKLREWKDYQSTMGVRYQVNQLRNTLAASGIPLEQDQVKPLLRAMASEQDRTMKEQMQQAQRGGIPRSMISPAGDPTANQLKWQEQEVERQAKSNKRLRDAVASILTAGQLRELEREHNDQLRMQEVQMRMIRAQAEAAARGDLPSPGAQGLTYPSETVAVPVR